MPVALRIAFLLALLLLAGACLEQEVETQDIVTTIPWPDQESAEYVLLDRDEEEIGRGALTVERRGAVFEFRSRFENDEASDESAIVVDATTLKPRSMRRELRDADEVQVIEAEYDTEEQVLHIVQIIDGEERPRPERLDEEHYYDNESSVFLWRTIDFREGYEAFYHSVLANQSGQQRLLKLEVIGKEQVEVPAGTFDAWRLEISTPQGRQVAWYSDTPERLLLRYDTRRNFLELAALPE